jgi:hypothetical protein
MAVCVCAEEGASSGRMTSRDSSYTGPAVSGRASGRRAAATHKHAGECVLRQTPDRRPSRRKPILRRPHDVRERRDERTQGPRKRRHQPRRRRSSGSHLRQRIQQRMHRLALEQRAQRHLGAIRQRRDDVGGLDAHGGGRVGE